MFTRTEYVPYEKKVSVNVTENRAPTDESVKILKQLEDEARNKILRSVACNENAFSGVRIDYCRDPMNMSHRYYLRFVLNGHEHIVVTDCPHNDYDSVQKSLVELVSKQVAERIVNLSLFEHMMSDKSKITMNP